MTTVSDPAAEREPDHVTPCWACQGRGLTGDLETDVLECTVCDGTGLGARHRAVAAVEAAETVRCCDPGPFCDDQPGCEVRTSAGPDESLPAAVDWSAYGPCPELNCYAATGNPCQWLGLDFESVARSTPHAERPKLAPAEVPVCLAASRHGGICAQPMPCDESRHVPAEPVPTERRTVSLEVLTDELRAVYSAEPIPAEARVVVVLRESGEPVLVADTDVPWTQTDLSPVKALRGLLTEMISGKNRLEREQLVRNVELLMPTPDVLAALDGRPDAQFWTAPVPVRAEDVQEGWIAYGYSGPGTEEPITTKNTQCTDPACPWPGDCTALTIGADPKPQHFADWTLLDVRIPCAVTR